MIATKRVLMRLSCQGDTSVDKHREYLDIWHAEDLVANMLGLRWSECAGLRVGDVDFLRRTLTVRETIAEVEGRLVVADTKSRSSRRTLSIPTFLVDELAEHLATPRTGASPDDLVFTDPEDGPLRRYSRRRALEGIYGGHGSGT